VKTALYQGLLALQDDRSYLSAEAVSGDLHMPMIDVYAAEDPFPAGAECPEATWTT
jgi:hypothetical protein